MKGDFYLTHETPRIQKEKRSCAHYKAKKRARITEGSKKHIGYGNSREFKGSGLPNTNHGRGTELSLNVLDSNVRLNAPLGRR